MTTAIATAVPLAITGCGVVTPAGSDLDALARGLRAQAPAGGDAAPDFVEDRPPVPLAPVSETGLVEQLGSRGVRHLDRTTHLGLLACARALSTMDRPLTVTDRATTGVVIGTSTGSIRSSSEFTRETLVQDKPYLVRANLFPNTVMNSCAGQIAMRNGLRGVNATIAGGQLSSFSALRYARNAIGQGHVDRALVGGVEELSSQSAWAWYLTGALAPGAAVGEGCSVFMVETTMAAAAAGRTPVAELLACEITGAGLGDERHSLAAAVTECVTRALHRSGTSPAEVSAVALGTTGQVGLARIERRGLRDAFDGVPPRELRVADLVGETFSASGALQVAALLAAWRPEPGEGRVAIATSVGHDGTAGCVVLRRPVPTD